MNEWWLDYRRIYGSLGLNELTLGHELSHATDYYAVISDEPYRCIDIAILYKCVSVGMILQAYIGRFVVSPSEGNNGTVYKISYTIWQLQN